MADVSQETLSYIGDASKKLVAAFKKTALPKHLKIQIL